MIGALRQIVERRPIDYNAGGSALLTAGPGILATEFDGLGIDFAYLDRAEQCRIRDTVTAGNAFRGNPYNQLTYTTPFIKLCRQSDGIYRYQSHNMYLNSAAPANQAITVIVSATYSIVITGSVSITWSGATTGTTTAGTTNFTAATVTLTGGSTSGSGTVAVYRTPSVGNYIATAGSALYDLPYEWSPAGVPLGIVIEEARTNSQRGSQALDISGNYTQERITLTANSVVAPDGTTTAETITPTNVSGAHRSYGNPSPLASATTVAMSVFIKPNGYTEVALRESETTGASVIFTLTGSGTIKGTHLPGGSTLTESQITAEVNGWYRLKAGFSFGATSANRSTGIYILNGTWASGDPQSISFAGDTTSGVYAWGVQCELGTFATSPIHTIGTTATTTRLVDNLSLATSLLPFSATVGTLYAKFRPYNTAAIRFAAAIDDGTANERFAIGSSAAAAGSFSVIDGGAAQTAPLTAGTVTANADNRVAVSWVANDFAISTNGSTVALDTAGTIPTVTSLKFGTAVSATSLLNGWLSEISYIKRTMSDTELIARATF